VVGADRICANGDVANKIGTLAHAAAARRFGVQTIVVAPWSTVDLATTSGAAITIEERGEDEVLGYGGQRLAPDGARAYNPVFDVTPADLVDAIVTERGIATAPYPESLRRLAEAG
jgi:methylthioribose-1-phosphate isomerase